MALKKNMVLAISLLGLGLAGVALAGVSTGSVKGAGAIEVNVVVMDGRLTVKPTKLTAGKVTFVAVNKGKVKHALAIMGNGLAPKRTPALAAGKSARLVVTLKPGQYHVWDPVTSSMSRATYLTVRKAASTGGSGGAAAKPSGSSGGSAGSGGYDYGGGGGASGGATPGGMDGMDGCDH